MYPSTADRDRKQLSVHGQNHTHMQKPKEPTTRGRNWGSEITRTQVNMSSDFFRWQESTKTRTQRILKKCIGSEKHKFNIT